MHKGSPLLPVSGFVVQVISSDRGERPQLSKSWMLSSNHERHPKGLDRQGHGKWDRCDMAHTDLSLVRGQSSQGSPHPTCSWVVRSGEKSVVTNLRIFTCRVLRDVNYKPLLGTIPHILCITTQVHVSASGAVKAWALTRL